MHISSLTRYPLFIITLLCAIFPSAAVSDPSSTESFVQEIKKFSPEQMLVAVEEFFNAADETEKTEIVGLLNNQPNASSAETSLQWAPTRISKGNFDFNRGGFRPAGDACDEAIKSRTINITLDLSRKNPDVEHMQGVEFLDLYDYQHGQKQNLDLLFKSRGRLHSFLVHSSDAGNQLLNKSLEKIVAPRSVTAVRNKNYRGQYGAHLEMWTLYVTEKNACHMVTALSSRILDNSDADKLDENFGLRSSASATSEYSDLSLFGISFGQTPEDTLAEFKEVFPEAKARMQINNKVLEFGSRSNKHFGTTAYTRPPDGIKNLKPGHLGEFYANVSVPFIAEYKLQGQVPNGDEVEATVNFIRDGAYFRSYSIDVEYNVAGNYLPFDSIAGTLTEKAQSVFPSFREHDFVGNLQQTVYEFRANTIVEGCYGGGRDRVENLVLLNCEPKLYIRISKSGNADGVGNFRFEVTDTRFSASVKYDASKRYHQYFSKYIESVNARMNTQNDQPKTALDKF